jgi:hypothetical protein
MQTKLDDYETEIVTDGGQEQTNPTWNPDAETVSDEWEGVFLHSSWGYGQTNTEMAQIVDVSDTGKTVKARMVRKEKVENDGHGSDRMRPTAEQYGEEFRLQVRSMGRDEPVFRGSYPFIDGTKDGGTRLDNLYVMDNDPEATVHQTANGYKH